MAKVSYKAKIINASRILDETVACYRDAIGYIENVVLAHYEELSAIKGDFASNARQAKIESLIHTTKKNEALYKGFDLRFYKFPSYLRRDAIATAYGDEHLKGTSAIRLFREFPRLRETQRKNQLWNPSYFVETIGSTSEENVRRYIASQSKTKKE